MAKSPDLLGRMRSGPRKIESIGTRATRGPRKPVGANEQTWVGARLSAEPIAKFGDVLHRVALTVNSSLELSEILKELGEIALDAIPADRCHLFLLDEGGTKLMPTFSIGRVTDMALWRRFKKMDPIDLKAVPARWEAFLSERPIPITDMASSPLIPKEIVSVFGSRSALIAKLEVNAEPFGVFSLDWVGERHECDIEEIQLIEAIAAYASLAIRNARLYEGLERKARTLERLVEVAAVLSSSPSLDSVLDLVCKTFEEILGTTHCSVNVVDEGRPAGVKTLAVRGDEWFTASPDQAPAVSLKEIARLNRLWKHAVKPEPVTYPHWDPQIALDSPAIPMSLRSAALFPLFSSGRPYGFVAAGFLKPGGPGKEDLEYGQALADQAAAAIEQMALKERAENGLRQVEVFNRLSDVVLGASSINAAVRALNKFLTPQLGIRLKSISIANKKVREAVGGKEPAPDEMDAIRSWRASAGRTGAGAGAPAPAIRKSKSDLLVPVVHGKRIQGALRVAVQSEKAPDESFLSEVANACGEVLHQAGLRKALAENERRLTIEQERDRIARDLHDSVGHILTGMGLRLVELIPTAPNDAWRQRLEQLKDLSSEGLAKVRETIESLLFLDVRKLGLAQSIKDMAASFEATTGIQVEVKVDGKPAHVGAPQEDALFRVVHEALTNVERHSRATFVAIMLRYRPRQVHVSISDDGAGLAHRDPFAVRRRPGHYGLRGLQTLLGDMGGRLEVKNIDPRGVLIQGRLPIAATKGKKGTKGAGGSSNNR